MQADSDKELGEVKNLSNSRLHSESEANLEQMDNDPQRDALTNSNVNEVKVAPPTSRKHRSRRFDASPTTISTMLDTYAEPTSPVSSTDQGSSVDITFEPTIEMMVNDFDDEQTLNEEEALAAIESEDPIDEIATLQKESEMPIEELLAKYQNTLPLPKVKVGKRKNKSGKGKGSKKCHKTESSTEKEQPIEDLKVESVSDVIVIDSGDEQGEKEREEIGADDDNDETEAKSDVENADVNTEEDYIDTQFIKGKHRRSHLMNLYPESFTNTNYKSKDIPLETLYGGEDEEYEEDDEPDVDYVRKTIMVGSAYQAVIPTGLSKYGDVLPYENEDKLIWEPCQVSEKEVEDYLLQTRDIKNILSEKDQGEEDVSIDEEQDAQNVSSHALYKNSDLQRNDEKIINIKIADAEKRVNSKGVSESETAKVVKDNEQALHLLVQCGYDFKEALRRERLNAIPLTGSMSIWSEEECRKFEEGIQKFGKDFLKIRQQQVRTRSMRELVQFYYLWKKSERRDHDFADSDTVDHMDMYLNEGDYSSNPVSTTNILNAGSGVASNLQVVNNKKGSCTPKNFSIMTGTCMVVSGSTSNATTNMCIAGISNHNAYSSKSGQARRHVSGGENNCQLIAEKN